MSGQSTIWPSWHGPDVVPPDNCGQILITYMWQGERWTDAGRYRLGQFTTLDGTVLPSIIGWALPAITR